MRVRLSARARRDLIAIGDWIRADNPSRAESFVDELEAACLGLADLPLAFPAYPSPTGALRKRIHGKFLILYRIDDAGVLVITVRHAARDTIA